MPLRAMLVLNNGDDSETLYAEALANAGFAVFFASSAAGALKQCANGPLDLIVADALLWNGERGREVVHQARKVNPAVRSLLLSRFPLDLLFACGAACAEDFLSRRMAFLRKPLPVPVLMGRILGLMDGDYAFPAPTVESTAGLYRAQAGVA